MNFTLSSIISVLTLCLVTNIMHTNANICSEFISLNASKRIATFTGNFSDNCNYPFNVEPGYVISFKCNLNKVIDSANCKNGGLWVSLTGISKNAVQKCSTEINGLSVSSQLYIGVKEFLNQSLTFTCTVERQQGNRNQDNCKCGIRKTSKIVNGTETLINEFPSMCAIMQYGNQLCGGTIISNLYVLTAAHCVFNQANVTIRVGEHNINTEAETKSMKEYDVNTIKTYSATNALPDDIALIELKEPIQFNDNVGPVCLPFGNRQDSFAGKIGTAVGWGSEEYGKIPSNVLRKVDLNIISPAECTGLNSNINLEHKICANTPFKDSCQYDSGGPLYYQCSDTRKLTQIGIISEGVGCATSSGSINVRITDYLDWIESTTGQKSFCKQTCN